MATARGGIRWAEQALALYGKYQSLRGRPDVIHAHDSIWAGYAAFLIHQRFGIPYVITEHSSNFRTQTLPAGADKLIGLAGDHAAHRIAVSEARAAAYRPYVSDRIEIIPNVVDTAFFRPPDIPKDQATFSFLAVGNLLEEKGFHLLLTAFAAKFRNSDNAVLRIVGSGPERGRLERLGDSLGIKSKVEFLGHMNREGVRSAMQAASVLVLPSFQETFGVVLIEAMATGIPVISTRCGGPEEIVTAEAGLLVGPGDLQELESALVEVRERVWDPSLIRLSADSRFASNVIAAALGQLYSTAVEPAKVGLSH